jgi:hypothetical protein
LSFSFSMLISPFIAKMWLCVHPEKNICRGNKTECDGEKL